MVGLERGKVELESHEEDWEKDYREEVRNLKSLLGEQAKDFEHIGITAIRGIKAKPIIDIILVVDNLNQTNKIISELENNRYDLRPNDGVEDRILLAKRPRKERTHYLSLTEKDSEFYQKTTSFRDYLNNQPKVREEYNQLKQKLASKHPKYREKYTQKKSKFIERTTRKARN